MKKPALVLAILLASACENVDRDLYNQISFKTQEYPRKTAPKGSVPVTGLAADYGGAEPASLAAPFPLDAGAAEKGKKLYDVHCAPCHGENGKSATKTAEKMDVAPFDLTEQSTQQLTDGGIFVKILASDTVMPKYRNELTDAEAWEVTAYVRKLQGKI